MMVLTTHERARYRVQQTKNVQMWSEEAPVNRKFAVRAMALRVVGGVV